jgi:hypothetical protein
VERVPSLANFKIEVYPNPTSSGFTIKILQHVAINNIEIYTMKGEYIKSFHYPKSSQGQSLVVDLKSQGQTLPTGIYLIKIISTSGVVIKKLMVL